jgi:hypothetical protein
MVSGLSQMPADHHLAAGLDAFGDGDFALARQQFDRAHFAQIHAHGIVGAPDFVFVDVARRRAGLDFLAVGLGIGVGLLVVAFFVVDDVDAHLGQHRHGVFDLLRGHFVGRQGFVQLVVGDVAALLGGFDHLFYGSIVEIEKRAVRCVGIVGLDFGFSLFCSHMAGNSWSGLCGAALTCGARPVENQNSAQQCSMPA